MMVSGDPGYVDQVPRRLEYEASHPGVEILYLGPYWQAIIREKGGQTIITRYELRALLDKLESLDAADDGEPGSEGPDLPTRAALTPRRRAPDGPCQHGRALASSGPPGRCEWPRPPGTVTLRPCRGSEGAPPARPRRRHP